MKIGLIDVDSHSRFPNLALMKLSAYHKAKGDEVAWYDIFGNYDIVYISKVFTFTPDYTQVISNAEMVIKGGTGYDLTSTLPRGAETIVPDYSIYPYIDKRTAYGFLTRGCIRKCPWCVVPKKEGGIHPYQDVDDIASDGRDHLILLDNNILASGNYGKRQLKKIIERGYKVDFNQAIDARLVTDELADILARVGWLRFIRFGCDTPSQVEWCERAVELIQASGYTGEFMLYTMLQGDDIRKNVEVVSYWRNKYGGKVTPHSQPCLRLDRILQDIPQWQKDLARWSNRREIYTSIPFEEYEPRKGFLCGEYLGIRNKAKDYVQMSDGRRLVQKNLFQ